MLKSSLIKTLLVALIAVTPAIAAENFNLKFDLELGPDVTSLMERGDTIRVVLRPEIQFGERSTPGTPIAKEIAWEPGMILDELLFEEAVAADQIYRLEMAIVRNDDRGREESVRYVSALTKLPRRPVDKAIPMRLTRDFSDTSRRAREMYGLRNNLVYVTRDDDGVYRVMVFFA